MRERLQPIAISTALVAAFFFAVGTASSDAKKVEWKQCHDYRDFECTLVKVPLNYADPDSKRLELRVARKMTRPGRPWLLYLSGGPGGAGVGELAAQLSEDKLREILEKRFNLLVYDQRGTGRSGALNCPRVQEGDQTPQALAECAARLGPDRVFYTTEDSSEDIERIQNKLHLSRELLTILGVSYGTTVGLVFAREHPNRVRQLILSGIRDPDNDDPFDLRTLRLGVKSMTRLCPNKCIGVSHNPADDLGTVLKQLEVKPETVVISSGKKNETKEVLVTAGSLAYLLVAAPDVWKPRIRGLFPAALRSVIDNNDFHPLARLISLIPSDNPIAPPAPSAPDDSITKFSMARAVLYCEEAPLAWPAQTEVVNQTPELKLAIGKLDPSSYAPFTPSILEAGRAAACLGWPPRQEERRPPRLDYPKIPVLILQGKEDSRTPPAESKQVAAKIPGAQRVLVGGDGHDVFAGNSCPFEQLEKFLEHLPTQTRCVSSKKDELFPAKPLPRNVADLSPAGSYDKNVGRTIMGFQVTLLDALNLYSKLASVQLKSVPGTYGGTVSEEGPHDYSVIPGLSISLVNGERSEFRVSGSDAVDGTLVLSEQLKIVGKLGHTPIDVEIGPNDPLYEPGQFRDTG